jgi:uncharacterized tellurite resistance protein B-like protein
MIARLLNSLLAPAPGRLPEPDARRALLVRLARADEHYEESERLRIDRVVASRYGLSYFEAAKIRAEAEVLEAEAPDTVRFTRALKDAVPHEDRVSLIEAMWQVALADEARDEREDALIRVTADLLGVSDRDRAIARQTVENAKK